jgi:hypothetical protein
MAPGYTFNLRDHYREACDRKYLITEVTMLATRPATWWPASARA